MFTHNCINLNILHVHDSKSLGDQAGATFDVTAAIQMQVVKN